jgi:hypothetical protein
MFAKQTPRAGLLSLFRGFNCVKAHSPSFSARIAALTFRHPRSRYITTRFVMCWNDLPWVDRHENFLGLHQWVALSSYGFPRRTSTTHAKPRAAVSHAPYKEAASAEFRLTGRCGNPASGMRIIVNAAIATTGVISDRLCASCRYDRSRHQNTSFRQDRLSGNHCGVRERTSRQRRDLKRR